MSAPERSGVKVGQCPQQVNTHEKENGTPGPRFTHRTWGSLRVSVVGAWRRICRCGAGRGVRKEGVRATRRGERFCRVKIGREKGEVKIPTLARLRRAGTTRKSGAPAETIKRQSQKPVPPANSSQVLDAHAQSVVCSRAEMQARNIFLGLLLFVAGLGVGYYAGRHPASLKSETKSEQSGTWRARVRIPGSVELPVENPIIKCTFARTLESSLGFLSVTHRNLTDRSYIVNYDVFGYDEKGQRVSQGTDEFVIGKRETVVRKLYLYSQEPGMGKIGSVFAIQIFPNED